jgi:hypothetical protein
VWLSRTDVSEDHHTSIIGVTRIGELGMLQEPHSITSQKMTFIIVTAVKTSNLKSHVMIILPSLKWRNKLFDCIKLFKTIGFQESLLNAETYIHNARVISSFS